MTAADVHGPSMPGGLKPGIHTIASEAYHLDPCETPSLSNSLLTTLLQKTPRHAWLEHPKLNPAWSPRPAAAVFDLGTAAHSVLLEGVDAVTIVDADDWRTKEAKEQRDKARKAGRIPMLPPQAASVIAMMHAVKEFVASSGLAGILERGKPEQTVIAKDSGVWCRARLDFLSDDYATILDYKTTGAGGPGMWMRSQLLAHGYDTQSVLYPRLLGAVGHRGARFLFLVQETEAPYLCYLVEPAGSLVELAESKINRGLRLWRDCLANDSWPGYPVDVHQAEAPVWAMKEEELHA